MANGRTMVTLSTSFGDVMISRNAYDTVAAVRGGDTYTMTDEMESDIKRLQDGLDVEALCEECLDGTELGSDEELGWTDWVEAAARMANA